MDYAINSRDQEIMSIVQGAKAAAEMDTTARATEVEMSVEDMMREAIGNGEKKMILKLLQHPDLNINFPVIENTFTFPMWAIMAKDLEIIQAVFSRKDIDFEIRSSYRVEGRVLDYAINSRDQEIMDIVFGAASTEQKLLHAIRREDREATLYCSRDPNLDINFPVNRNNLTFIMWAITTGDFELIQTVFSRKEIDFEVRDN